ncbi:MAG: glycosyltransferase [Desulfobulbaceae bacterium]|nr:glycosyltransferase [Desulfobulbaceae bacterium]
MRIFQNFRLGPPYLYWINTKHKKIDQSSYSKRYKLLLNDRYGGVHILKPILDESKDAFLAYGDDKISQRFWARENGMATCNLEKILLSQIEDHRTEVLYQCDPERYPSNFVNRLPGCVRKTIVWRGSTVNIPNLSTYDCVVSDFEFLNEKWRKNGWRSAWFAPSWDPVMAEYSSGDNYTSDITFCGSYARTNGYDTRIELLNSLAKFQGLENQVNFYLSVKKYGRLLDSRPWRWIPWPIFLPRALSSFVRQPLFGRAMYAAFASSKIVINPATDMVGVERGNMRCWEALGCGACMVASKGKYPEGFEEGVNFETYTSAEDAQKRIIDLLADEARRKKMARAGRDMVAKVWSKERQWNDFVDLVASL